MIIPWVLILTMFGVALYPRHNDNDELKPFVQEYMSLVGTFCSPKQLNYPPYTSVGFISKFPTLESNPFQRIAGTCAATDFYWKILISREVWAGLSQQEKESLMFHELSHCIIYKDHVENRGNYMYTSIVDLDPIDLRSQLLEDAWTYCTGKR